MKDIIKISKPTLKTKPIQFDPQYEDGKKIGIAGEEFGASSPYITINTLAFWDDYIYEFEMDTSGFLPRVKFIINDINARLVNEFMPIDDIACVYIRSDNTDFESVRQDFKIISFQNLGTNLYAVDGVLNVPNLYNDEIFGHKGTSFSCLKKIASELGIGFASNISDTNDSMYHICSNTNYKEFIEKDIMEYIYKDDKSFFTCYIDQWYYLNLVEINSLISSTIDPEEMSFVSMGGELHEEKDKDIEGLFLSNLPESDGRANFISGYDIINYGGRKGIKNGYRQNIIYYDKDKKEHNQYFVESLTTEGIDTDSRVIKGERTEDHTKNIRNIHFESLFVDNAHDNYFFAKVFNKINIEELSKFNVRFYMNGVNYALSNYMSIPIHITNNNQNYEDSEGNDTNIPLSGSYIITGMQYKYSLTDGGATRLTFIGKKREIRKRDIDETI